MCCRAFFLTFLRYQDLGDGKGTDYIFVGHDCFMRGGLYVDNQGKEYEDDRPYGPCDAMGHVGPCGANIWHRGVGWVPANRFLRFLG